VRKEAIQTDENEKGENGIPDTTQDKFDLHGIPSKQGVETKILHQRADRRSQFMPHNAYFPS